MELNELKARAYDLIAMMEKIQMELRAVNDEIVKVSNNESQARENAVHPVSESVDTKE